MISSKLTPLHLAYPVTQSESNTWIASRGWDGICKIFGTKKEIFWLHPFSLIFSTFKLPESFWNRFRSILLAQEMNFKKIRSNFFDFFLSKKIKKSSKILGFFFKKIWKNDDFSRFFKNLEKSIFEIFFKKKSKHFSNFFQKKIRQEKIKHFRWDFF